MFFPNQDLLHEFSQKSSELAKKEVIGASYFKKILDFWMNHYKSGQLFIPFIKGVCLDVQGWICMYILMVLPFSMKLIKNSHQNLPI